MSTSIMAAIQKSASIEKGPHDEEDIAIHTETFAIKREALGHDLPARYWMSPGFIGTVAALCFGNTSNYASWVQPSNSLTVINESIGPSDNITWVSLAYTLGLAVGKFSSLVTASEATLLIQPKRLSGCWKAVRHIWEKMVSRYCDLK